MRPPVPKPDKTARIKPGQFAKEVRAEARRISWTSWKETWITSVMVVIMVVGLAILLSIIDAVLGFLSWWLFSHV